MTYLAPSLDKEGARYVIYVEDMPSTLKCENDGKTHSATIIFVANLTDFNKITI